MYKKKWYKHNVDPLFDIECNQDVQQLRSTHTNKQQDSANLTQNMILLISIQRYASIAVVVLYSLFLLLFMLRAYESTFFWQYCILSAFISYGFMIYFSFQNQWPVGSLDSIIQFIFKFSRNQYMHYLLYSFIMLRTKHISAVALFPLAVHGYYDTLEFIMSKQYSIPRTTEQGSPLKQKEKYIAYAVAAAELLTLPILLWRLISGLNPEVSVLDIVFLVQFIYQRDAISEETREIINHILSILEKHSV